MKFLGITAFALIALTSGTSTAAPIEHLSRLPGRCLPHPQGAYELGGQKCFYFYGWQHDIEYFPSEGDQVVKKLTDRFFQSGYQLADMPVFVRVVQTGSIAFLRGVPKPGIYTIAVYKNGIRAPTLDIRLNLIPR